MTNILKTFLGIAASLVFSYGFAFIACDLSPVCVPPTTLAELIW